MAARVACASKTSSRAAATPARSSSRAFSAERVVPVTSCPARRSSGTSRRPIAPVAPARNTLMILCYTSTQRRPEKLWLTLGARWIRVWLMIRPGFLSAAERGALIAVARDGLVEHRVARRGDAVGLFYYAVNSAKGGAGLLLDAD